MGPRQLISSASPWEPKVGYSRAVRVGNRIYVAGTVAADADGNVVCPGDAYGQARYAIERIAKALAEAGASLANVVRTRMFVTDISRQEEFGRAHGEAFRHVRPAATMVEVKALMLPGLLIEIEADAEL
ncbi:MAG TPA: RidA family protein [Bryobacteraceae bacterium]|nr:RidA family protein [Bryobacteraceae bacterium]